AARREHAQAWAGLDRDEADLAEDRDQPRRVRRRARVRAGSLEEPREPVAGERLAGDRELLVHRHELTAHVERPARDRQRELDLRLAPGEMREAGTGRVREERLARRP